MTRMRIALTGPGLGRVLKSPAVAHAVTDLATHIGKAVDDQGLVAESGWARTGVGPDITGTVTTGETKTRARATVTIKHPAAKAMQARHGVMTKAAASVGAEIRS